VRFKSLDLNLLVAFDVLTETCSVTKAARQLRLSQPAVSAALERLRVFFNDPLLVPQGKRMLPTAMADGMRPIVKGILADVDTLVASSQQFDPGTSKRVFRLAASDYVTNVLLAPLCATLEREAPQVGLDFQLPAEHTSERFVRGEFDLFIAPDDHLIPGHPSDLLMEERHVVVGWSGNPVVKADVTERVFLAQGHVGVAIGGFRGTPTSERQLAALGKHCRYEVTVPAFSLVPGALLYTTRLATMYERLARALATQYPLMIVPMPFALPKTRVMMQHHKSRGADKGLGWLRTRITQAVGGSLPARPR
jgi:DNA-binding transcriptional LysR family regulator